jgi:hypothetical protein
VNEQFRIDTVEPISSGSKVSRAAGGGESLPLMEMKAPPPPAKGRTTGPGPGPGSTDRQQPPIHTHHTSRRNHCQWHGPSRTTCRSKLTWPHTRDDIPCRRNMIQTQNGATMAQIRQRQAYSQPSTTCHFVEQHPQRQQQRTLNLNKNVSK